jgi:hypothetical protein
MENKVETVQEHQTVTVEIPAELRKICMITGKGPSEVITTALNIYLGGRIPKEERFVSKRHFSIPRSTFVLFALPSHEWEKLEGWVSNEDKITIAPSSNGEVFLLNETKLHKRNERKKTHR